MTVTYNTDDSLHLAQRIFTQMNCIMDIILDSVDLLMFSDAGHLIELQVQLINYSVGFAPVGSTAHKVFM